MQNGRAASLQEVLLEAVTSFFLARIKMKKGGEAAEDPSACLRNRHSGYVLCPECGKPMRGTARVVASQGCEGGWIGVRVVWEGGMVLMWETGWEGGADVRVRVRFGGLGMVGEICFGGVRL